MIFLSFILYEIYKFSFQIKFKITFCYLFNSSIFLFHTTALDLAREIGNQEILELLQNSPSQTLPVKKGPVKKHPMKKVSPASTPVKTVPVTSESVSDTHPANSSDKNMPPKKRPIQKGPVKISRKKKD